VQQQLVAYTPSVGEDSVAIRHEPELKNGALALSKKGMIRFTHWAVMVLGRGTA
jgi:hypothetical protein